MPEIENQTVTDYKAKLRDRARAKYPDRNFDAPNETGETDVLAQSLSEEFDSLDQQLKEYQDHEQQFMGLLKTSPSASTFFNAWVRSGDAAQAFREAYGREAFNALNSEEGAEIIAQIEADEAKKNADNEASKAEKAKNLEESFNLLDQIGEEKGLDDQGKLDLFKFVNEQYQQAERGIYTREMFEAAYKGRKYDTDVEAARHEGEVAGRNTRISDMTKGNRPRPNVVPMLQGQGQRTIENPKPKPQTEGDFWAD